MLHPRKLDGSRLSVITMPDGRVFVDPPQERNRHGEIVGRGGPEHSKHFHRMGDYGLASGLVRCVKCGLVKEGEQWSKV